MFLNHERNYRRPKRAVPYSIAKAPAQARGFNNRKFVAPRKKFTDSSMTSAPKRRIYAVGRRERSKNLKVYFPSPFLLYAFSPRNPRSFCKLFTRGKCVVNCKFCSAGGSAKKSKLFVRLRFECNSRLPELRSDRLRCLFILSYKKTLDFFAKCGYNINRGCTKLTVTPKLRR